MLSNLGHISLGSGWREVIVCTGGISLNDLLLLRKSGLVIVGGVKGSLGEPPVEGFCLLTVQHLDRVYPNMHSNMFPCHLLSLGVF